jgi:hypothetical protein
MINFDVQLLKILKRLESMIKFETHKQTSCWNENLNVASQYRHGTMKTQTRKSFRFCDLLMKNQKQISHKTQALYSLTIFSSNVQYVNVMYHRSEAETRTSSWTFINKSRSARIIRWKMWDYSRIAWRRLHLRLMKKSLALCDIINKCSSFFDTKIQAAIDRKEVRKYRCMKNMTVDYYDLREQQIM